MILTSGSLSRLTSSDRRTVWKIADEIATPETWPRPRNNCAKPIATAMDGSEEG
jgi:hypothetical protein